MLPPHQPKTNPLVPVLPNRDISSPLVKGLIKQYTLSLRGQVPSPLYPPYPGSLYLAVDSPNWVRSVPQQNNLLWPPFQSSCAEARGLLHGPLSPSQAPDNFAPEAAFFLFVAVLIIYLLSFGLEILVEATFFFSWRGYILKRNFFSKRVGCFFILCSWFVVSPHICRRTSSLFRDRVRLARR